TEGLGLMADPEEIRDECHRRAGAQAAEAGVDELIAIGDGTLPIIEGAAGDDHRTGGADGVAAATHVPDQTAAIELLRNRLRPGDTVLVKGSRHRTWDVADHLRAKEDNDQ